jgi:hypothetical protein
VTKRSSKQSIDVVSALVTEREKYEQWIAALLDKKANTPQKVFDRVYADYTARLEAVMEELGARSTELDGQLEALRAKSQDLGEQEAKLREEHSEAELRHAIGEHTPDQWRDIVAASNQAIGKLSAERARVDAELESLERIIAGIGGESSAAAGPSKPAAPPPAAPTPPPAPKTVTPSASSAPVERAQAKPPGEEKTRWGGAPPSKTDSPAPPARKTPASVPSADVAKAAPPGPKKPGDAGFDELAFLQSVVPEGTPDAASGRAAKKVTGSQPELAFGDQRPPAAPAASRSGEGPKVTSPATETKPAEKPAEQPPISSKIETTPSSPAAARDANAPLRSSRVMSESDIGAIGVENLSESAPAVNETPTFLKNVPSEQTKTLKCGECGAMNYATEWYCERCGAELSAL